MKGYVALGPGGHWLALWSSGGNLGHHTLLSRYPEDRSWVEWLGPAQHRAWHQVTLGHR